jgi:hypothetical protein
MVKTCIGGKVIIHFAASWLRRPRSNKRTTLSGAAKICFKTSKAAVLYVQSQQGILAPLLVRELEESKYEVVAGARRLRAARLRDARTRHQFVTKTRLFSVNFGVGKDGKARELKGLRGVTSKLTR